MSFLLIIFTILSLSLFFTLRFGMPSSAAPMFSIALITVFLCVAGMLNLLVIGCYFVFASAIASLGYIFILKRYPVKRIISEFMTPGVVFFIAGSVFFFYLLAEKHAIFRDWDEFSFWGTAAKVVFMNHKLYTFVPTSRPLSSPPALPVFSYFVQFFNISFIERYTYLAYDMMIVAALSAMFSRIKWKNIAAFLVLIIFSLLGVYAFFRSSEGLRAYATAYSDMQIGFLLGGSLMMWFSFKGAGFIRYFSTLTTLILLVLCKDIGFAVALISATVIVSDMIISKDYPNPEILKLKRITVANLALPGLITLASVLIFLFKSQLLGIIIFLLSIALAAFLCFDIIRFCERFRIISGYLWRILIILLPFITVVFFYRLWAIHYAAVLSVSRDPRLRVSFFDILGGKNDYFNLVFDEMKFRFFNNTLICFGTIFEMTLIFTFAPITISLLTKDKIRITRVSTFSIMMALGFLAYYFFHAYLYVANFPNYVELGLPFDLPSFNRYISSYAIGWMFAVLGILFQEISKPFFSKQFLSFIPAVAAAMAMIISIFYYLPDHPDQYLLTSKKVDVSVCVPRVAMMKHLGRTRSAFNADDRIYFMSFETDSGEWFCFLYEAYPALLAEELGWFVDPVSDNIPDRYIAMDKIGFSDYLREEGIDFVYINYRIDDYFLSEFSALFEDYLMMTYDDSARLYYVFDDGGETVSLIPVYSAEHINYLRES